MDLKPPALGYEFTPSRYDSHLGYAHLRVVICASPCGRYFDVRSLHLPTFDGRLVHQTEIGAHALAPAESFQVCLGALSLESHRGDVLHAFSFGGELRTCPSAQEIHAELISPAPLFRLPEDRHGGPLRGPGSGPLDLSSLLVEEVLDMLAESQAELPGHEEELYARLARHDPYQVFLSCLVSLEQRVERLPPIQQPQSYRQVANELHQAIQAVRRADGWDGRAPRLEELLGSE